MNCMQHRYLSMNRSDKPFRKLVTGFLRQFSRKEDGVVTIEAVMIFPLIFWGMWASYSFFDGYRHSARNLKAAYALADVLSRESSTVDADYITTLYDLQQWMISDRSDVSMRVSFLRWDEPDDRHYVLWSCVRGESYDEWTDASVGDIKDKLPVMQDNGTMILVETLDLYTRPFKIGFGDHEFSMENFIFTQPRGYHNINATDDC